MFYVCVEATLFKKFQLPQNAPPSFQPTPKSHPLLNSFYSPYHNIFMKSFILYCLLLGLALQFNLLPSLTPTQRVVDAPNARFDYPVRLTYIDRINQWWPPEAIAGNIGVPGYAKDSIYNFIALAFWSTSGPLDIVNIWADPMKYFGGASIFGSSNDEVQKKLKKLYNDKGIKILISAFGATEFPTSAGIDPIDCANKLGGFVNANNLDGVDIDWEDNAAMEAGKGEAWLISFTRRLRELLPNHIITHAPQAPYFKQEYYPGGAYVTVHQQVGNLIDFYNVQFYNQGNTQYDTYNGLFLSSGSVFSGTSVKEIIQRGIPANKIVVGKPVTPGDASNTGWVSSNDLGQWTTTAYQTMNWYAGVMFWQYASDSDMQAIQRSVGYLKEQCETKRNCK